MGKSGKVACRTAPQPLRDDRAGPSRPGQSLDRWPVFGFRGVLELIRRVFSVVQIEPDEPAADQPMEGVTFA